MNHKPLLFLAFLLFLSSCNKQGEDHSYSVKEYIRLGIPQINRPWTNDEFVSAVNILRLIKERDSLALPRYDSKRSGDLFKHMISMENLAFLKGELFSLHDKTFMLQNFLNIEGMLTGIYMNRQSGLQYYSKELTRLYIFAITITQKMLDLAYEINISENRDARCMKSGLPAVQHIHEKMLIYVLKEQGHTDSYATDDLEIMGDSISAAIRRNMDWFDSRTIAFLRTELMTIADRSGSEKIRNDYLDLSKQLGGQ